MDASTNLTDFLSVGVERLIELIESLQEGEWMDIRRGFTFRHFNQCLQTSCRIIVYTLPKFLASKKAIINPKNSDQECFKWAVTEAVYPQKSNCDRITKPAKLTPKSSTGWH